MVEKQHGETKRRPEQETNGVITRLFPEEGYGFIQALEGGYQIYFHRNSVAHGDFEDLKVGDAMELTEQQGEEGPQASTVRKLSAR